MKEFFSGDKVERLDGKLFSSNSMVATVNFVDGEKVWFRETATWMGRSSLRLFTPINSRILDVLEEQRNELQAEIKQLLSKVSKKEEELKDIRITIKTVKNYL